MERFDKRTLTLDFPKTLDHIKGRDANFEMSSSNTAKATKLAYSHNIASKTHGVVFVSTELKGWDGAETWTYKDALSRSEVIRETFAEKHMLNLDKVDMCVDHTKEMII